MISKKVARNSSSINFFNKWFAVKSYVKFEICRMNFIKQLKAAKILSTGKLQFMTTSAILKYNVVNENCKSKT